MTQAFINGPEILSSSDFGAVGPFNGLIFIQAGPGIARVEDCCNCGDCLVLYVEDGVYIDAFVRRQGFSVSEYQTVEIPQILDGGDAPDTGIDLNGYYKVGYRHGNPRDLKADLATEGCCHTRDLPLTAITGPIVLSELPLLTTPRVDYFAQLQEAESTIAQLQVEAEQAADVAVEAAATIDSQAAQIVAAEQTISGLQAETVQLNGEIAALDIANSSLQLEVQQLMVDLQDVVEQLEPTPEQQQLVALRNRLQELSGSVVPAFQRCTESFGCATEQAQSFKVPSIQPLVLPAAEGPEADCTSPELAISQALQHLKAVVIESPCIVKEQGEAEEDYPCGPLRVGSSLVPCPGQIAQ